MYAVIDKHAGKLSTRKACELLGVRRQGYYERHRREESPRRQMDELLRIKIQNLFYENHRIYGARKIQVLLRKEGFSVSRRRIRRLMAACGLVPVAFRRWKHTTNSQHGLPVFPNLLAGAFEAPAANRIWVTDMTYVPTEEGWLYLCTILDIYSRRVVGWAVSTRIDRHLAIQALENAVKMRNPDRGWILHSDRGSPFASDDFRSTVLAAQGIQSMSRCGNPYDNACAESFFHSLKGEFLNPRHFQTRQQAQDAIAQYMLFYNRLRIHASLGYRSPVDFEAHFQHGSVA